MSQQPWGPPQQAAPAPQEQYHDEFFGGAGGDGVPGAKFTSRPGPQPGNVTEVGACVFGTVVSQSEMDQMIVGTKDPVLDDKGRVKKQLRVVLQTDERGWNKTAKAPTDPDGNALPPEADTGLRAIYVKGWMIGAIADAIRKANAPGLRPGGRLAVTVTELVPTTKGNPFAKYEAFYEPPAAGDVMFSQQQAPQAAPPAAQPAPQVQYAQPPVQQQVPQQYAQGGQFPPGVQTVTNHGPAQQVQPQAAPPAQPAPQQAPQPQAAPPAQDPFAGAGAPQGQQPNWGGGAPAYDEPPF